MIKRASLLMAGQVAIEYLVGFALLVWVFFVGDPSLVQLLTRAFQARFSAFSWEISLP